MLALDQSLTLEYLGSTYTLKAQHLLAAGEGNASVSLERGLLTEHTQVTFSAAPGALQGTPSCKLHVTESHSMHAHAQLGPCCTRLLWQAGAPGWNPSLHVHPD